MANTVAVVVCPEGYEGPPAAPAQSWTGGARAPDPRVDPEPDVYARTAETSEQQPGAQAMPVRSSTAHAESPDGEQGR
jgi:hypothetical protein